MRNLIIALVGIAVLASCDNADPTDKDDMGCTATFHGVSACTQLHITEAEALAAKAKCEEDSGINGTWDSNPCNTTGRISGYCKVEASQYSLSGTDAKVFFYGEDNALNQAAAATACGEGGGEWFAGP